METLSEIRTLYTQMNIARLAHCIWVSEGCPEGHATEHWLQAEALLKHANSNVNSKCS